MIPTENIDPTQLEDEPSIDLRQYLGLFRQWWWLILLAGLLAGAGAYLYSRQMTPIYQASTTLLVSTDALGMTTDYSSMLTSEQLVLNYIEMITKRPVMEAVIERLGLSMSPEVLAGRISASPVRDTQMMRVKVSHPDPRLAAELANTVTDVFATQIMQGQQNRYSVSLTTLKLQMDELNGQIEGIQEEIAAARAAEETGLAVINRLETERSQSNVRLLDLLIAEVSQELVPVKLAEATNRAEVERLEALVARSQLYGGTPNPQQVEALAAAREAHLRNLTDISRLEARLRQYEQAYATLAYSQQTGQAADGSAAGATSAQLQRMVDQANADLTGARARLAEVQVEIERLEARQAQYEQRYTTLSISYEQARLSENRAGASITQLESAAVPAAPVSPNTVQNTLLGAVVGMMLAAGGIFAYDFLDDRIKDPEEVTRRFRLPVLGVIAHYERASDDFADGEEPLVTRERPRSPITEAFRSLRTNIQYASPDDRPRTLLVTSPSPGEGKTTIAANLCVVLAQGGSRVTVMEGDLRRPTLHHRFNVANDAGISTLLLQPPAAAVHFNGTLKQTATAGLLAIPAGILPSNPAELLGSRRMNALLEALKEQADVVVIDAPPVLPVADPVVLSALVDAVILVVKANTTRLSELKAAISSLRRVNANIIGVVVNDVDPRNSRYGYYYKSYYYQGSYIVEEGPRAAREKRSKQRAH